MKVAVILSGCGVFDGAEIHESVLTVLALHRRGCEVEYLAPDMPQARVVNHLTGQVEEAESRNVLVEAARIARGNIKSLQSANAADYAAVFFPGGFGAATNFSSFATEGANCTIQADVLNFAREIARLAIPACYVCIAPALLPHVYGQGILLTIGNDVGTADAIEAMGGIHKICPVKECIVDTQHKVVSSPAYMLANNVAEVADGIDHAVAATLALI